MRITDPDHKDHSVPDHEDQRIITAHGYPRILGSKREVLTLPSFASHFTAYINTSPSSGQAWFDNHFMALQHSHSFCSNCDSVTNITSSKGLEKLLAELPGCCLCFGLST